MKLTTEKLHFTVMVTFLIIIISVAVPMIVMGAPDQAPGGGYNLPNARFNSISIGSPQNGPAMTGSFGRYVGSTSSLSTPKYNGSAMGGYAGAKDKCGTVAQNSHVCSAKEMINSYEQGVIIPDNGNLWVNNGVPAYVQYVSNDCQGWTSNSNQQFGSVWDTKNKRGFMTACNQNMKIACCIY